MDTKSESKFCETHALAKLRAEYPISSWYNYLCTGNSYLLKNSGKVGVTSQPPNY
jgi:hypothetical protein